MEKQDKVEVKLTYKNKSVSHRYDPNEQDFADGEQLAFNIHIMWVKLLRLLGLK